MKHIALLLILLVALKATAQSQQKNEQITVDGIDRQFVTYVPSANEQDKLPVIISLHGRLGTGKSMMSFADFRPIADKEKFIIVCPDGINRSWNDGRRTPAAKKGINDVKFIDQLITYITQTYHGDAARVYVAGMSNGGFMTSRLACELNARIAAIAVVAASMNKGVGYRSTLPMPAMYIEGTLDPLVPFAGGEMKKGAGGEIYGHEEVLQSWATADSIYTKPVITKLPIIADDGTSVIKEVYSNTNGKQVVGYTIVDGGHTWPGGTQYLPKFLIGKRSDNLNACQVIWDFFKRYRHTSNGIIKQ